MKEFGPAASACYRSVVFSVSVLLKLALTILMLNTPANAAKITINLVGDPWPPYVDGELGGYAESGIAVEIIKRVFAQLVDAEVRFPLIPWKRALLEVERGENDGIPMLVRTRERESYMQFTAPLVTGYNLIWSVAASDGRVFEWNSIEDLFGKTIGVVQGYSYGDEIDRSLAAGSINSIEAPTVEQLFSMLEAGRVELIMANDAVGFELARQHRGVNIQPSSKAASSETFYIGFSKKSAAVSLIPQINLAIERLKQQGIIDRIVRGEHID